MMNGRDFLTSSAALAGVAGMASAEPRSDWFQKSPRVFLLDFQMPDPVNIWEVVEIS